ncbi:MAG: response regulator transcription factor [Chloroflexi bacterium]|nr:response regulator transcription factor [Chloroflexota bacterium]
MAEGNEKQCILILSSDPKLLDFVRANLGRFGCRLVQMKDSGDKLKEVLTELKPAMVVVDAMPPTLIGVPLSLRVRQWSSVPTILLTSWQAGEDRVRGVDVNSASGLTNPLSIDELMEWMNLAFRSSNCASSS